MNDRERAIQLLEELSEEVANVAVNQPPGDTRAQLLDMSERIDDFLLEEADDDLQVVDYDDLGAA